MPIQPLSPARDRRRPDAHNKHVVSCPRCSGRVELVRRAAGLLMGACSKCARCYGMLR